MQVAAALKDALKESQDWDARAAQEVEAAQARGADLVALVDRKESRAGYLRSKAERSQAEASSEPHAPGLAEAAAVAQAEVTAQHLPAFSGAAPVLSRDSYREWEHHFGCRPVVKMSGLHAVPVWLLLSEFTTPGHYRATIDHCSFSVALSSAAARLWQQEP